jgi:hypothetical protein
MAKGVTVNCDKLEVTVAGQTINPREGETITIRPTLPLGLEQELDNFRLETVALSEIDRGDNHTDKLNEIYDRMKNLLNEIILGWTWTDIEGEVMSIPKDDPTVVQRELGPDEIHWILGLYAKAAVAEEVKKDDA